MFSLWVRIIIAVILITLALSNLQEDKMLPAAGCFLLATLFVLKPGKIMSILLAISASVVIVGFGLEQLLEKLLKIIQDTRRFLYVVGLYLFTIHAVVFFQKTKLLTAAVLSLLAVFCAIMIFREIRLMKKERQRYSP